MFSFFSSPAKRTNNASNTTHYVRLGKNDERVPDAITALLVSE